MSPPSHLAVILTGHSVPGCTGLSRAQREFQRRSCLPPERWCPHNFPFVGTTPFPEPVPLLAASWSNTRHFLASRRPEFAARHRDAVAALFAPFDAVIVLAGSCGLELLNNLGLPEDIRRRLHVFACGPVSRRRPDTASFRITQGRGDLLSRLFHPRADHRISGGHLDYLAAPETLPLFDDFCRRVLTEGRA